MLTFVLTHSNLDARLEHISAAAWELYVANRVWCTNVRARIKFDMYMACSMIIAEHC